MDPELTEAWRRYRDALLALYGGEVGPRLAEADEDAAASFSGQAEELTAEFLERLQTEGEAPEDGYELETAVLATAALDVAVACELILLSKEDGEILAEPPEEMLEATPDREELEPLPVLLWRAESAFGDGVPAKAGSAPDLIPAEARAQRAIEEILESGASPAIAFARGMLLAELDTLQAGLHLFSGLSELAIGRRHFRIGSGLLVKAVEKLLALTKLRLGSDLTAHFGLQRLSGALEARVQKFNKMLIRNVVRAALAERRVERHLNDKQPDDAEILDLDAALAVLCIRHERNMHSAATIAKWVGFCSPGVVWLGGYLPGKILIGAVNGAGLAYSLHSCGDRLDTVPGWVAGVPAIVESKIE